MTLDEFNALDAQQAQELLLRCVNIPSWAEDVTSHRPYATTQDVYQYAEQSAQQWEWEDILASLQNHPKLGQSSTQKKVSEQEAQHSQQEQSSLSSDTSPEKTALLHSLDQAQQEYQDKFGFIFLIRALGRDASEVLSEIQRRIVLPLEMEKKEVHTELKDIALLRLTREVS